MNQQSDQSHAAIAASLQRALEAKDREAYTALFAKDVVFYSPIEEAPMQGREMLSLVLSTVFGLFEDFRYHARAEGGSDAEGEPLHVLCFTARIGDVPVEGVDLVRFNAQGLVQEFKVLLRPFAALELLHQEMGRRLGPPPPPAH